MANPTQKRKRENRFRRGIADVIAGRDEPAIPLAQNEALNRTQAILNQRLVSMSPKPIDAIPFSIEPIELQEDKSRSHARDNASSQALSQAATDASTNALGNAISH